MNAGFLFFPLLLGAEGDKAAPFGHAFRTVTHAPVALRGIVGAVTDVFHPRDDQVDVDDDKDQKECR